MCFKYECRYGGRSDDKERVEGKIGADHCSTLSTRNLILGESSRESLRAASKSKPPSASRALRTEGSLGVEPNLRLERP